MWLFSIFAAPWLMEHGRTMIAMTLFEGFSAICHRIPDRSFYYHGYPLGVCSRCTGIYAGFVIGLALYPLFRRLDNPGFPSRWWLAAAGLPAAIDVIGGALGFFSNSFFSRSATGAIFGAGAAFYLLPGFVSLFTSFNLSNQVQSAGRRSR
jgi:uncharacterized membrane protein